MARLGKYLSLCLVVILAVSTMLMINSTSAQSISIPEFTLKYVDHSYDVPPKPSSSINPYTGEIIDTTVPGYHIENKTVDVDITNNGASYYNFRYKGHYEDNWRYYPFSPKSELGYFLPDAYGIPTPASTSSHTILSLNFLPDIPKNGTIDIQVQGLFGDFNAVPYVHFGGVPGGPTYDFYYEGEVSDWSNTQTITIPASSDSPSPSPTVPEFPITALMLVVPVAVSLLLIIGKKRQSSI